MYNQYRQMQRTIDLAVMREREQGDFRRHVHRQLPALHRSIQLPEGDSALHLTCFAIRYVRSVPPWLHQLHHQLAAADIDFNPVQVMIDQCLERMSGIAGERPQLHTLVPEAYLSHRVMEEINDRLQPLCGAPLLPMDPMRANLVIRGLLNEKHCEEMDSESARLGRAFMDLKLDSEMTVALILCRQRFSHDPGEWPDLAHSLEFGLLTPGAVISNDTVH
ncbi:MULTISPECIES: hypothetical protein [Microbulbifer]|uniref:hypothetical protein n=1 Tax=Microbulbifer TaxID=48073 RepID=UPI001E384F34|nr:MULTISPECIES: hypothetical protein [Microbulbifer]UHQ54040.1 hypothetical protein LVE68_10985 [Microbulbifer sp. YPW16]